MVISDKPVNVGDVCKVGEFLGTVEDIGIRSTRIRTLDRTVVSVPNGLLASMILENFAERDRILFHHTVGLGHQTTAEQMRDVLTQIRGLLDCSSQGGRRRPHAPGSSGSAPRRWTSRSSPTCSRAEQPAFLAIQEDLLLGIIDIIDSSGTSIAAPVPAAFLATGRLSVINGRPGAHAP